MRDLIEKLQKIEEGFFSELDIELQELKARKPDATPAEIVAHIRRVMGDDAAEYVEKNVVNEGSINGWPVREETYSEMVEYWKADLSRAIVRKGVFKELYAAANHDIDELNAAIEEEAESIAERYHGSGEGIGTSDVNHFIVSIGRSLGVDDIFGWNLKKESIEESAPELLDREGYHLSVRKGEFLPSEMLDGRVVLHDMENISPGTDNPKIVTFDDLTLAKEAAKKFGGMVVRTALQTYRIVPIMKGDEEMERDKAIRGMKANKTIRGLQGLSEEDDEYCDYCVGWDDEDQLVCPECFGSRSIQGSSIEEADDGADVATEYGGPYEDYENWLGKKVKIDRTISGKHEGELGTVVKADKYRDETGGWQAEFDVKLDSGETIKMYPGEWSYDQLMLVVDPYGDFMLDNPFESLGEEIDPEWGGAVEEWMEHRREGFRDARDGVYRPEAYVGKAKEAYKLGKEDWVSLMAQESIQEGVVKVPRGLRGEPGNPLGLTSQDAEDFINSLGPDDVVATEVVDPETGEVLDWPDQGTRRERRMKQYKRDELEREKEAEKDHEEGYDSPYLYVSGLDKEPENAWEGIETLKYDREFTDFYNIVWRDIEDLVDNPEMYYEGDYDIGISIPVAIKRKDGKKFNKQDRQNFDMINKIFRAATFNIGVQYVGSSDQGTVARFIPTFM